MLKIPRHGLTKTCVQSVGGVPAEFDTDFRRIHGVAAIMAGAVRNKGNEAAWLCDLPPVNDLPVMSRFIML
jgi:hypothetical protein